METLEEATPHLCYWGLLLGVIEILNVSRKVCHWNSSHQDPQYLTKGALSIFQAPPWGSPSLPELEYPHPCLQEVGVLALPLGATSCQLPLGAPLLAIMLATNRRLSLPRPLMQILWTQTEFLAIGLQAEGICDTKCKIKRKLLQKVQTSWSQKSIVSSEDFASF